MWAYPTNVSSFSSLATYVNTVTNNWFWTLIVAAVFIITIIGFGNRYSKENVIVSAAFICLILSVLFRVMELVGDSLIFFFVVIIAVGLIYMHIQGRAT
jgi:hypothetical protein